MSARGTAAALLAALIAAFVVAGGAFAHGDDIEYTDPGYGMGYGMEPNSNSDYCPGADCCPGMMGGNCMGPGMMSGHGMGSGMMGNHGMGPGMMNGGRIYGLELNSDQRKQIAQINSELRKRNWALQGEIIDAQEQLFQLYAEETPNAKKIGAVYGKIFDVRRQMIEAAIDSRNRQRAILTEEQREQLRKEPNGWGNGNYGHGRGSMGHKNGRHMMGG